MSGWLRTRAAKILLPSLILVAAVAVTFAMIRTRPKAETRAREVVPPLVRVLTVRKQDLQLRVHSQGTVVPRTQTTLVSEVDGRVLEVSDSFVSGGFFDPDDVLLRLDPTDFELAVVRARAAVAQAEVRVALEEAEADVAKREWQDLGEGEPAPLVTRGPQLEQARAALEAARAALQQAEVDLKRTRVRAPFLGRVREKLVDVGQSVVPGQSLARIYAIDYAEVRLPVPDEDLAFVDLPMTHRERSDGSGPQTPLPRVIVSTRFAGAVYEWEGRIVRTEGEIDPQSRMVHVVAQVPDPYRRREDPNHPPLAAGLFVDAEIFGNEVRDVVVLPRAAMRGRDQVLVVDAGERLRFRRVDVLRAERERILVRGGLQEGEHVCLSSLEAVTDGMRVRATEDEPPLQNPPAERPLPQEREPHANSPGGSGGGTP